MPPSANTSARLAARRRHVRDLKGRILNLDGSVNRPISALRFILRQCGVRDVRLLPRDSQALISNFLRNRLKDVFYQFIKLASCKAHQTIAKPGEMQMRRGRRLGCP
jgi:hypothetical protein